MSFVLARPKPGITPEELTRRIHDATGLKARTRNEFRWDCINYYMENTGIPVNFGITISIALLIGLVVSGQTFYLFTVENLKQFGALKAIGVTNAGLIGMILLQALTVGFIGYSLGTGMAATFFEIFSHKMATRGIILMWETVVGVGVLMGFVVIAASLLSIRRVLVLEPAAVFRG
jgi:putative ABC transport system permease protein